VGSVILGLEEVEKFKDMKIAFSDAKAHKSDTNYSVDEEIDDKASKENIPRRWRHKASRTLREEHSNKYIHLGSQNTIPNILGSMKPQKILGSNAAPKGGIPSQPP
jgi:hypothetical protein